MKYYSPTLQHRVRSLPPRLRMPTHWPTTPPCSADPFQNALGTSARPGAHRFWPADPHSPYLSSHPRHLSTPFKTSRRAGNWPSKIGRGPFSSEQKSFLLSVEL